MKAIVVFDIDGVIRDVGNSYRRALADTVERFTDSAYRPTMDDIDQLKSEGIWNNDWEGSQELVYRYFESQGQGRSQVTINYEELVAFFQSRYRGSDPDVWTGYITTEPLLMRSSYLDSLSESDIAWGFFSGATRGSAEYVLQKRLGLQDPVLIAMEDAPGKPDPSGLFVVVEMLAEEANIPVIYVGDTVADMYTVFKARELQPQRLWFGVGILPPHVHESEERSRKYSQQLQAAGATIVLRNVEDLQPQQVESLLA